MTQKACQGSHDGTMLWSQMGQADDPYDGIPAAEYERLRQHLTRAVAHVCPHVLAERREDLVQESLLRVLDLASRTGSDRRFSSTYLYKVAYSALMDELRRMFRRRESQLEEGAPVPSHNPDGNPEAVAIAGEIGRGILDCLACLAHERRLGVALYLQGHSVAEAAQILDWGTKKTENLIYRGLDDLRDCLAAKGMKP